MKPTYPQAIVLRQLANGGYLTTGFPKAYSPRLYCRDGSLFALVPRQTLTALLKRQWVLTTTLGRRASDDRHTITSAGRVALRQWAS